MLEVQLYLAVKWSGLIQFQEYEKTLAAFLYKFTLNGQTMGLQPLRQRIFCPIKMDNFRLDNSFTLRISLWATIQHTRSMQSLQKCLPSMGQRLQIILSGLKRT